MGNCTSAATDQRYGCRTAVSSFGRAELSHKGIRTVRVKEEYHRAHCNFSSGNSDLCISVLTWNMNGQVCYEDLVELFSGHDRKYDLLVVGLQEAPRRNVSRLLQSAVVNTHMLLGKSTMQSLQLYVFGPYHNADLLLKEVKVEKHSLGGCGGMARRKKGAVSICINYNGIRMVFISCHLSAHAGNVEERNREFRDITDELFSKNRNPYSKPCHVTVWLGDLNYRIHGMDTFPVRDLIHNHLHTDMLTSKDQLLQEAGRGEVFNGFCEGNLTFKPTYKYNIGSSNYDTSHKVRVPSWTDRILFKIEEREGISATLHSYESVDEIYSSDHKPVRAHLCLRLADDKSTL
ncbi:Type IV inositol polyphosphate 5-phosphatase 11 [Linum perenne]